MNFAHFLSPVLNILAYVCFTYNYRVVEKCLDTFAIFQYQATIFYAQFYQMNSITNRLTGINTWFLIEILSFYGYIFSAIIFIFTHSLSCSLGFTKKPIHDTDPSYKHDFIAYNRKDLDWAAFVQILFNVNMGLIAIDRYILFKDEVIDPDAIHPHPLSHVVYLLLANHVLQMIFLKNFYTPDRKVNTANKWVWVVHLFSYMYSIHIYCFTDARNVETS